MRIVKPPVLCLAWSLIGAITLGKKTVEVHFYGALQPVEGIVNPDWVQVENDLAILVVPQVPVQQVLSLGSARQVRAGHLVRAIGHPDGIQWYQSKGEVGKREKSNAQFAFQGVQRNSPIYSQEKLWASPILWSQLPGIRIEGNVLL